MAKIDRMLVGESLVGDGNEVAHIDLIIGPRGTAAESLNGSFGVEPCIGQPLRGHLR